MSSNDFDVDVIESAKFLSIVVSVVVISEKRVSIVVYISENFTAIVSANSCIVVSS